MIKTILMVGLGGGAGSILRFAIQKWMQHPATGFPTATFLINVVGCFLIGLLWGVANRSLNWNEDIKLLLMTGFCGGFTTFSAFSLESLGLIKEKRFELFLLYAGGSLIIGLIATFAGIRIIK